ncbi:hypothetical protein ASF58_02960 [Methylobacterium sp. Leaf125]|nr:hypothetical protein ASF58_02960 [Methylobacterium sp. Leaf125]
MGERKTILPPPDRNAAADRVGHERVDHATLSASRMASRLRRSPVVRVSIRNTCAPPIEEARDILGLRLRHHPLDSLT